MTLETGLHAAYLTVGDSDELEQSETDRLTAERAPGPRAVPHKLDQIWWPVSLILVASCSKISIATRLRTLTYPRIL
jgi:hypothetical protein